VIFYKFCYIEPNLSTHQTKNTLTNRGFASILSTLDFFLTHSGSVTHMSSAKDAQSSVVISEKKLIIHTVFGLTRITLYLALPAFTAVFLERHFFPSPSNGIKMLFLFGGLIIGWGLIAADYFFVMKRTTLVKSKEDSVSNDPQ
jgi:hypothetical protein